MPAPIPVVVFAGQSNANNTGSIGAIFQYVAAHQGLLVQAARNGSPLASSDAGPDWSAGAVTGELLIDLYALLDPLFDPTSPTYVQGAYLDGVIWSQGGADIYSRASANSYYDNLLALISALQSRYGTHEFVISGFADSSLTGRGLTGQLAQNWHIIKAAQLALDALPHVSLIDPDQVASVHGYQADQMYRWDYIHYTQTGFGATLGAALADVVLPQGSGTAHLGDSGPNIFRVLAQGLSQIYGHDGLDQLVLAPTQKSALLLDQGFTTSRVVDRSGDGSFHIDLIAVEIVQLTPNADEARLGGVVSLIATLGGSDKVIGSDFAETALLGNGNDYAALLAGDDLIAGGHGRDTILGGAGDDRLFGGTGNYVLNGGAGNDRLTGGRGADQFIFEPSQGRDTITDFQPDWDHLVIERATWSDVTLRGYGRGTEISFSDTTIILPNVLPSQLDSDDFIFR